MGGIISQVKMREKKNLKTSSMKTILEEKSEFFQVLVDWLYIELSKNGGIINIKWLKSTEWSSISKTTRVW